MRHLRLVGPDPVDPTDVKQIMNPLQLLQETCKVMSEHLAEVAKELDVDHLTILDPSLQQTIQVLKTLENNAVVVAFRTGHLSFSDPLVAAPT